MISKKQSSILHFVTILLLGSLLIISGCGKEMTEAISESAITVNTVTAEQRDIYKSTSYSGRLKARSEVEVFPKTSEQVISIQVAEGQEVMAGETLMILDSSSLQPSLKQAEAQVASARANQANNEISLEAARKNYERTKELYDNGAVTLLELETAEDEYSSLQSGSVEAAVAQAEASLLSVQEQVAYCNITAPVSGAVGRIDVSVGDYVTTSSTVAVISDPQQLQAEIMVGESDITKIELNTQVDVYVESVSEDAFTGTVSSIATVLNSSSDMYPITVTVDNSAGKIKSGMYAEIMIHTSGVQNALCIPLSAIIPDNGVNIVYTVDDESRAARTEVETGINDNNYIQVLSGLKAGDKVITLGNTLISNGSLLTTESEEGE